MGYVSPSLISLKALDQGSLQKSSPSLSSQRSQVGKFQRALASEATPPYATLTCCVVWRSRHEALQIVTIWDTNPGAQRLRKPLHLWMLVGHAESFIGWLITPCAFKGAFEGCLEHSERLKHLQVGVYANFPQCLIHNKINHRNCLRLWGA